MDEPEPTPDTVRAEDAVIFEHFEKIVDGLRDMTGEDDAPRVRTQANLALVAVAERVCRIMRRDLPPN